MVKNLEKIVRIYGANTFYIDDNMYKFRYTIIDNEGEKTSIPVSLPYNSRPKKTSNIILDTNDFVNGFKVVQTENLEYAYVREEDNALLPYRYDIATNFNKYGYAMVGKDGKVSWIDKSFRYLNNNREMVKEEGSATYTGFKGFLSINNFSKGEHPLSKICNIEHNKEVCYFGTDGNIKEFYRYDGDKIREDESNKIFSYYSTEFDDAGYATANDGSLILLSSGYYLIAKDLIKICRDKGFLDTISNRIEKQEQAYAKFLRDIEEKTTTLADNLSKVNNLKADYSIGGIELRKEELISRYGKDVYRRALTNSSFSCLIYNQELPAEIVDLELFQSSLAKRGITSYIDYEENVFHYNTNKHVKVKKQSTC